MTRFLLKNIFLCLALLSIILSACAPKTQNNAEDLFKQAEKAYQNDSMNVASILLDSIHTTYKTDLSIRKQADTLQYRIEIFISNRNIDYLSTLSKKNAEELEQAFKNFNFKKDEKYEDIGRYIPRKNDKDISAAKAFVKPYCDEHGQLFLQSFYHGKNKKHNHLEAQVKDAKSATSSLNEGSITRYKNQGINYEIMLFNESQLLDVFGFIELNSKESITIELQGSSNYTFKLSSNEKKAFLQVLNLSTLLKNQDEILKQLVRNEKKLVILEKKLN